jgi:uncharacterized lipoprotein YbaY
MPIAGVSMCAVSDAGKLEMTSNTTPIVKGEILFEEDMDSFSKATVRVYLEDVSLLDAPSKVVAEQVIPNISHEKGTEERLEFALYGEIPDERASYSIHVHVDLQGDEEIQRGDYITMQSYPVLTFGYPDTVLVRVRQVK